MERRSIRVIISGGGTGGHIFPALSIAGEIMRVNPKSEILFVGAQGRMEMERVPAAGYKITGLPVAGLKRSFSLDNLKLPYKIVKSVLIARGVIKEFKPDIVVGVGGYASAPTLWSASHLSIPTLIQEQNSYAGLTNRILGRRASGICVAYDGMERFFPKERIIKSGNPIRPGISPSSAEQKREALSHFGLQQDKKTILIVGGSLGAGSLNRAMMRWIERGVEDNIQIIWQYGRYYAPGVKDFLKGREVKNVVASEFISDIDKAFAAADIVISRAGAGTISELCAAGKAVIYVPSPNVTEDHQTHNAMALVNNDAATMVSDMMAVENLPTKAIELLNNPDLIQKYQERSLSMALPGASKTIVEEIYKIIGGE